MNRKISIAAFAIGLLTVGWVGIGYVGNSPLALAMTLIIAAVYLTGALELRHYQQATDALAQALDAIPENLEYLGDWLVTLPSSLQNVVRLRIEGERVGLPGPGITPYLVGLLVLLGMLGTFLGMVVTLNGAVIALESTTDLQTIRSALTAPVKGLGFAFGTSVAGVAASAMLGLISALCRRERLHAGQVLDTRIATVLRGFSLAHQRQATFSALQYQAKALPEVVDKLQAMLAQMEIHSQQLNDRLLTNQESHHRDTRSIFTDLAAAVDHSLQQNLTASARLAGETIQPLVSATMRGIAEETTALHTKVAASVERQLASVGEHFAQRSAALLDQLEHNHSAQQAELAVKLAGMTSDTSARQTEFTNRVASQIDTLASRFDASVSQVAATWNASLSKQQQLNDEFARDLQQAQVSIAEGFAQRSAELLTTLQAAHSDLQRTLATQDEQRQASLTHTLATMANALQQEWQTTGSQTLAQQERICQLLGDTARDIASTAQAQTSHTIGEVTRLMETAAAAPRAAAEVIGQLRQELSASMARDNTLLEERSRIMETLSTLLDAINHASTEQRGAIDALVAAAAGQLERVGQQFENRLTDESAKMHSVATQITGSAVEVASLSDAFTGAVQLFGESNDKLMGTLQRIEAALAKSMTRSDDQLAYYVAQAREIIDLSIMSQKQIVEDLQRLSSQPVGGA